MTRRSRAWLVLAFVCAAGCGDEQPTEQAPVSATEVREPAVEPVSRMDKARFALDRLFTGPKHTQGLRLTDLHRQNLRLAQLDLAAMPVETLRLLADEQLIERLTTAHPNNQDPWHNVLGLLSVITSKPADLVAQWTERAVQSPFATLRRQAMRALASQPEVTHGAIILSLLERDPDDREAAQLALRTLLGFGDPWRTRALDVMYRAGSPLMWTRVANSIEESAPPGARGGEIASALFWWQALTEGSGPRLTAMQPRVKRFPWAQRQSWLDASVRRSEGAGPVAPYPEANNGWLGTSLADAAIFPSLAYRVNGTSPAADARCALAREGMAAFVASVHADRTLPEDHPLQRKALHCMLPGDEMEGRQNVMARLEEALQQAIESGQIDPQTMGQLVDGVPAPETNPAARALLERVIRTLPDPPAARLVINRASDRLALLGPGWIEFLSGLLESDDRVDAGRALHLIFRANDPRFVGPLEKYMATLPEDQQRGLYRRIVFLYASGRVEPARTERFVRDLARRLEEVPEAEMRGMVSALLDFGETGADAYARGLLGPRRRFYLQGWPIGTRQVPVHVARAALKPLGAQNVGEVAAVLNLAYHTFPEDAAPALVALKSKLGPRERAWVDVVLDRVRHRAAR